MKKAEKKLITTLRRTPNLICSIRNRSGFDVSCGITGTSEYDKSCTHVLIDRVVDDLMLPFQVVDTVLLVRELPAAFGTLEGVLLAALVLQVTVEIVVPVVGPLAMRTRVDSFRLTRRRRVGLLLVGLRLAAFLPASLLFHLVGIV